jgi:hypothetical protein
MKGGKQGRGEGAVEITGEMDQGQGEEHFQVGLVSVDHQYRARFMGIIVNRIRFAASTEACPVNRLVG